MREIARHGAGRVFLGVLLATILIMLYLPVYFDEPILLFGWMTVPFVVGIAFIGVWLIAYLVYFFGFWPFRR